VLVAANFLASAGLIAWAVRISPAALMAAVLGGFLVRLGALAGIVSLVRDQAWVELTPLLFTVLIAHLGLLVWETRYVPLSLAYPGLKPRQEH
nr:ATP synthase subunit I [Acidimicrobiia bacterium]